MLNLFGYMRLFIAAFVLLLLSAPSTQAAASLDIEQAEAGWFRMWCWDQEFVATTPGAWREACMKHLEENIIPCIQSGRWCRPVIPLTIPPSPCPGVDEGVNEVRACMHDLLVSPGPPAPIRVLCLDRIIDGNTLVGTTWMCVDYVVFDRVVCAELRC